MYNENKVRPDDSLAAHARHGWMDGWMDGWMEGTPGLKTAALNRLDKIPVISQPPSFFF